MNSVPDDNLQELPLLDADLLAPGLLHELRQPLMGADAAATLLERALGEALTRHDDWRLLRGQLARVGEILAGFDQLFRVVDAEPAAFSVDAAVRRAVDLLAHRVRPLGRRFAVAEEGAVGFGAPGAVIHAATNLLANALDAVETVRGAPRVEVRVLPGEASVEVRVSDEGVGIASEHRDRIFEPRFTTKPPGKGTGLGLHVARRLMSRFGGAVYLVDAADPGRLPWAVTEFCIAVPAAPAQEARP